MHLLEEVLQADVIPRDIARVDYRAIVGEAHKLKSGGRLHNLVAPPVGHCGYSIVGGAVSPHCGARGIVQPDNGSVYLPIGRVGGEQLHRVHQHAVERAGHLEQAVGAAIDRHDVSAEQRGGNRDAVEQLRFLGDRDINHCQGLQAIGVGLQGDYRQRQDEGHAIGNHRLGVQDSDPAGIGARAKAHRGVRGFGDVEWGAVEDQGAIHGQQGHPIGLAIKS